ncbi:hypothetical protein ACTXT7_004920 [Hymenolepis weldensis]
MVQILSAEVKVLSVSQNSSRNSTPSPILPIFPKVLPTTTVVQVTSDTKLHSSVRDSVKVTNLRLSMESSMSKDAQKDIKKIVILLHPPELMNDKCNESKEIGLAKHASLTNGTVSKVAAQNAGIAVLPYRQDLNAHKLTFLSLTLISVYLALAKESPILIELECRYYTRVDYNVSCFLPWIIGSARLLPGLLKVEDSVHPEFKKVGIQTP